MARETRINIIKPKTSPSPTATYVVVSNFSTDFFAGLSD